MPGKVNNLVEETTATVGTGVITLSAEAGFARFAQVYSVGDVVEYAIKDGANFETGLGTVGAANTLARTTIYETLIAGTYLNTGATAISLSGAATVRNVVTRQWLCGTGASGLGSMATQGIPTGTGFAHVTAGAWDAAAVTSVGGGSVVLAAFAPKAPVRKSGDTNRASTTTLADDPDLLIPIAANEELVATFNLSFGAALQTTGVKVAITTPSGATQEIDAVITADTTALASADAFRRATASGTSFTWTAADLASDNSAQIRVWVWVLNGSTPGNITLQWSPTNSTATNLTLRKGSNAVPTRIA